MIQWNNQFLGLCVICGKPNLPPNVPKSRLLTCSEPCHEALVSELENEFGKYKRVVDQVTNLEYRVPTRDLIEKGLSHSDLVKYPLWEDL